MPQRNSDDIADALAAMGRGEVEEEPANEPPKPQRPTRPTPKIQAAAPTAKPRPKRPAAPVAEIRPAAPPPSRPAAPPLSVVDQKSVDHRRTLIPPALVLGVLLLVLAVVWQVLHAIAPLHPLHLAGSQTLAIVMATVGVVSLSIAGLNMAAVAKQQPA